jgi:hypothetical protein
MTFLDDELRLYFHALNQPVTNCIDMMDDLIDKELSTFVVNHLVDLDADSSIFFGCEGLRLNAGIKGLELTFPVIPHGVSTQHSATFHPVRPVHVGVHRREDGFDFPAVEGCVDSLKQFNLDRYRV